VVVILKYLYCAHVFAVPFLSGLSSSRVGVSTGDGVDAATVAVINEICERALQSDVAAAIAAARAIAGVIWNFLIKYLQFSSLPQV
jgi:hypothetical protein